MKFIVFDYYIKYHYTTMFIIQINVNKFQSFQPSYGHHYIKYKRLVTCNVH